MFSRLSALFTSIKERKLDWRVTRVSYSNSAINGFVNVTSRKIKTSISKIDFWNESVFSRWESVSIQSALQMNHGVPCYHRSETKRRRKRVLIHKSETSHRLERYIAFQLSTIERVIHLRSKMHSKLCRRFGRDIC